MIPAVASAALFATFAASQSTPPGPSFEELSAKARQAYEAKRLDEARTLFTRALKLRPQWPEGWWGLGLLQYETEHYPECRDALTRMVRLDPPAAPGWAMLGLCEFHTKQYGPSFDHLKRAHMLVPAGSGGPLLDIADYHLGLLLTQQGAFEVSQEVMMKVAHHVRDNRDMLFACGLASLRMPILPGEVRTADREVVFLAGKVFWDLATRPPAEAEADFAALMAKYPDFPNVHYFYGTYLAVHKPEEAAREFLQELRVTPDSVPARVQLALRYIVEQRLEEALKLAREAVALSPDSVGAQLALGRALRANGDDEGALAAFTRARRLDPVSPEIRLYIVNSYRALGRMDEMRREQAEHGRLKAQQQNWP